MSYRSTPDNEYFGASFISVGGVKSRDIDVPEHRKKIGKSPLWGHRYLGFYIHPLRI